jgi:hypothetical protein
VESCTRTNLVVEHLVDASLDYICNSMFMLVHLWSGSVSVDCSGYEDQLI